MWAVIYGAAYEFWNSFYDPPSTDRIDVLESMLAIGDAPVPFELRGSYVSEFGRQRRDYWPNDEVVMILDIVEDELTVRVSEIRGRSRPSADA